MRLINLEKVVFDYSGLAYIDPLDFQKTSEYFMRQLKEQPTIEPEQKRGKWICWYEVIEHNTSTEYVPHCKCSQCETEYDPHSARFMNYCPNCGSYNGGEE